MRVVFVNRFFYPDISATSQLLTDVAFHFAHEMEVSVVTGRFAYHGGAPIGPSYEVVRGVHVHRVWTSRFGRGWLPGRALDYLTFYLSAFFRLLVVLRRGDVVVALTDPPIVSVIAALAAALKGARLVNWLQDIFPETAHALGVSAGPFGGLVRRLRDVSLRQASANIALSEGMATTLTRLGIAADHVHVMHNWADGTQVRPLEPQRNPLRREWGLGERFVVGYSGNMGRVHELGVIMRAAIRLRGNPRILFLFIGEGHGKAALESTAREHRMDNVMFRPYQPRDALGLSLTVPDCHLVSLKSSLEGLVFPSKLYSSLAAGRPIVFIGSRDAEICRMISEGPAFGTCVEEKDDEALARALLALEEDRELAAGMGAAARALFESRFDLPHALSRWEKLLMGCR